MYKTFKSLMQILNHPLNKTSRVKALGRLLWWKYNQFFLKLPAIVELKVGVKCICYPDSSYSGLVIYKTLPEYYEMSYIANTLKKGDVFIDIGANIGAVSLIAASSIGNKGVVYAFEPNKLVVPRLIENIQLNNFSRIIEVSTDAVSDSVKKVEFVDELASEISHISYSKKAVKKGSSISATSLKRFVIDKEIERVKMVKVDVEGAELGVLKGCIGIFDRIESMLIEINQNSERYGNSIQETLNFILDNGFEIYCFNETGKLQKLKNYNNLSGVINVLAVNEKI